MMVLFGFWITVGCDRTPEPSPAHPLLMSVSAVYKKDTVRLEPVGSVFVGTTGPQPVDYDQTEVWLSEGRPGDLKLIQTTDRKTIDLTGLQPNKIYYVAVRGSKGAYRSELSAPVLVVPDPVKPARQLQQTANSVSFYLSPAGTYSLVQSMESKDIALTQSATGKVQQLTYPSTIFFRTWLGNGDRILFEVPSNQRRRYVVYDAVKGTFSDFPLPAIANVWEAAFSPDGKKIAYTDYNRTGNVLIYDTDTKTDKRTALAKPYEMVWTADSRSLLIHRYGSSSVDAHEIVQFDPEKDAVTKTLFVTPAKGTVERPALSPAGDKLLFSSTLSGRPHLWLYDLTTEKLRPVMQSSYQFGWLSGSEFYAVEQGPAAGVWLYRE